ncbi:MAG: 4Fe-4S binding protein, partial [Spirochaetes bacterium]|nr:4Fe-4S binding protein [Spirochaetota bacterium]
MVERRRSRLPVVALLVIGLAALAPAALPAADRVPRPEFTSGYEEPSVQTPAPRSEVLEYLDVAVLAICLTLSGWLAIRARSREGIFLLSVFSIAYFGFFRKGCICPIGAIQNVALALADPTYAVPVVAVAFFALPLVTALAVGRTFCAAVCPFGALQDAVIVKLLRLPRWLTVPLGFLPVVYLGLSVLFAATGAEFIVCRFDPFVNFFRIGGSVEILALGGGFLLLGTVVARPYCRFLCPYGVILGWLSRLSVRHASISP